MGTIVPKADQVHLRRLQERVLTLTQPGRKGQKGNEGQGMKGIKGWKGGKCMHIVLLSFRGQKKPSLIRLKS